MTRKLLVLVEAVATEAFDRSAVAAMSVCSGSEQAVREAIAAARADYMRLLGAVAWMQQHQELAAQLDELDDAQA